MAGQIVVFGLVLLAGILGGRWPGPASPWRFIGAALLGIGGLLLGIGAAVGLGRQLTPLPAPVLGGELRDEGAYGLCRHPMYGGVILLCLAFALATSPWALAAVALTGAFLDMKRRLEEAWLEHRFPGYAQYRRRVPRQFIPFLW